LVLPNEGDFVRPIRVGYTHVACGSRTRIGSEIAETYARDPKFYTDTFCVHCGKHFHLINEKGEAAFLWDSDNTPVGS
jgi:hypothetical protein